MPPRVTIVGAGIIGLTTAFELTEWSARTHTELDVRICDPKPISGATFHAAGMLAPAAEMQYKQEALLPLMKQSAQWYESLVERVSRAFKDGLAATQGVGARQDGTFVVAADAADKTHLHELLQLQQQMGMDAQATTIRTLRRSEPMLAPGLAGAVHIPGDHQIDPREFGRTVMHILSDRGVNFEKQKACPNDILTAENGVTIVSNGLGAKEFYPELNLRPVRGDIVRLRVPEHLDPLVTSVIRGFVHDRPVYLVPRDGGRLVLGATSREDDTKGPLAGGVLDLLRDAAQICPGIRECEIEEITAGERPGTPDDLPYIGTDVARKTVVSTGYFRHGILLAALGARAGAQLAVNLLGGSDGAEGSEDGIWRQPGDQEPEVSLREVLEVSQLSRR